MSLLGTGISRIRVVLASVALLTVAAVLMGFGFNGETKDASASAATTRAPFRGSERSSLRSQLSQLPLFFEANQGQTDSRVKFLARGSGYGLFLTADQAVLELQGAPKETSILTMQLVGAQTQSRVHGADTLGGKSNYFVGKDPTKWHRDVPQFARVRYEGVYPGIDLVYYGKQGQLEYDFEVAPGADPKEMVLQFAGTEQVKLDESGNLVLASKGGDVRLEAPRVYQKVGTEQRPVNGKFVLRSANEVGFEIGEYDRSRELVIDPTLSYASFLGGGAAEGCRAVLGTPRSGCPAIAVDAAFNMYVAGTTTSTDFPLSATPYQATNKGAADVFVTKFDITGSTVVFSTYLGGTGNDTTAGLAVDAATNVYVAGNTVSSDFPTIATNAPQVAPLSANNHAFASELSPDGMTLLYSTYLGGSGVDTATGLALDFHGKMYLMGTTSSGDFPVSATALQALPKAMNQFFITKLDPIAADPSASLAYSTYLGGATPSTGTVTGGGIAVDTSSNVYVTGGTTFTDMGLNSSQTQAGANDAIVGKFTLTNSANAQEVYLTYMGGTGDDIGYGVGVDTSFNAYITGSTTSTDVTTVTPLPTGVVPFQAASGGGMDAFVAKFGSICTGTSCTTTNVPFNYFSYLGGSGTDVGLAIAVDPSQGARIAGYTNSTNLVAQNGFQGSNGGGFDGLVSRIDTTSAISSSSGNFVSYEGGSGDDRSTGIAVDSAGNTYVSGETASGNFPLKNAFQGALKGGSDGYVSKISPTANFTMTVAATPTPAVGVGNPVTFTFTVTNVGDLTSGVTFTNTLPAANATFVSATATGGTCGGATGTPATVVCNLGTMNASATATVTVILTPTAGPGTISDSATITVPGSAFTISKSASVTVNDFSISANPSTATVPAGVPANYTLTLTPTGPIPNSIALSCSSGLPSGGTCTFTTTTIPNLSNGAATSTVHVNTTVRPKPAAALEHGTGGPLYAMLLPLAGVALMGLGGKKRRVLSAFMVTGFLGLVMLQAGCGSSSTTPPVTGGTPAGTYTVTLTGTSGSVSRTTTVTLVVQ